MISFPPTWDLSHFNVAQFIGLPFSGFYRRVALDIYFLPNPLPRLFKLSFSPETDFAIWRGIVLSRVYQASLKADFLFL